jgi:hypothetical protein
MYTFLKTEDKQLLEIFWVIGGFLLLPITYYPCTIAYLL